MESAKLSSAHEHVRNAATATYGGSVSTAGDEHASAAAAFHSAAQDTHNAEALRILALLEDHHLKLARLIKEPPRKKEHRAGAGSAAPSDVTSAPAPAPAPTSATAHARTSSPSTSSPARPPSRRRLPHSSIASNLAEKRGIPGARRGTPTASPVSVTNALATRNDRQATPVRDLLQQQSRKAADAANRDTDEPTARTAHPPKPLDISPPPDEGFRRFYSAFGGMLNTIAAPLAFTSLPLNPLGSSSSSPATIKPDATTSSSTKEKVKEKDAQPPDRPLSPSASRTIKSSEPDLASLISKPALLALRSDQSGPLGPLANNESFYFVPTSGGTLSYANILRDPQAHPHHAAQDPHLDSIAEGEDGGERSTGGSGLRGSSHEEFVDARESLNPPSPTTTRRPRSKGPATTGVTMTTAQSIRAGSGRGLKSMEELALENETLRGLIDKQAKRLSMWETTSQSSYNALAQSFRARGGGTIRQQMSDPSALAQALAMGSGAVPALPSPPPVPNIPEQYRSKDTPTSEQDSQGMRNQEKRIAELEALLATRSSELNDVTTEKNNLAKQNEKHAQVIGRYREQWEKLKAGARKKEQERRGRRLNEIKAGEQGNDSESGGNEVAVGDGEGEGGEDLVDEEGLGKA